MPAKSEKQAKFMRAVAHSPSFAKKVGVPMSVGKEFSKSEGGMASKMNPGFAAMMKKKASAKKMAKGGYAGGGLAAGHKSADGIATKGKTKAKQIAMKKGGMCK